MHVPQLRLAGLLLVASLCVWGCPNEGVDRFIPPGPTSTPAPATASIFVYAAEAISPNQDVNGGGVSAYQLGTDGLLGGNPISFAPAVNPRRLLVHPALDVLYVASTTQV